MRDQFHRRSSVASAVSASKHMKKITTNRTFGGKQNTMYVQMAKIPYTGLLPCKERKRYVNRRWHQ